MKAVRKIVFLTILAVLILYSPSVSASELDIIWQVAKEYAEAGEGVMVDGPFIIEGNPYWVIDYVIKGEVQASLAYDFEAKQFIADREKMRKVFATKKFKNTTQVDPLFYGVGDPNIITIGAKYDTQNVRNFAAFTLMDPEEFEILNVFLEDYETISQKIADSIRITNFLLHPGVKIRASYEEYPLKIIIETQDKTQNFSYEGSLQLLNAYEDVYKEYSKLVIGINAFTGTVLDELPPGTTIREKAGIKITRESILGEIDLVDTNGKELRREIDFRRNILIGDYKDEIKTAEKRLQRERSLSLKIGIILISLISVLILRYQRKKKSAGLSILLILMILPIFTAPVMTLEIPTPEELLAKQVQDASQVPIKIFAEGIDSNITRNIVEGYPLILEGESIYVSGPFYHEDKAYYLFDVVDNGLPTGNVIIVDVSSLHMVGGYRLVARMMQTSIMTSLVRQKPIYQKVDPDLLEKEAMEVSESTMAVFLSRLAENVRKGKELEDRFIEKPDFETARDLSRYYRRGFLLLEKMQQVASPTVIEDLTQGFVKDKTWLEAYSLIMKYQLIDKNLGISQARYRGRALNRIPTMLELQGFGMFPSKPQVIHDLTTDLIYGNAFIWRLGKIELPYFAALPRKIGELSLPGGIPVT